jgi:hypothetical protein
MGMGNASAGSPVELSAPVRLDEPARRLHGLTAMNTTIRKISLVLRLATRRMIVNPHESVLNARVALWVVLITVLARLTSLPHVQKIASFKIRSTSVEDRSETPAQLGRAIDSVLGIDLFVFRRSCWKRALVLHRFLALNGIESEIKFGVRKEIDGTVTGHAWLEHQGRPVLEDDADAYIVTFSLPRKPSASGYVTVERAQSSVETAVRKFVAHHVLSQTSR